MATRDQTGSLTSSLAEGRSSSSSTMGVGLAVALVGAIALGVGGLVSRFSYTTIARLENITDLRAAQVSTMYGWCLVMVWIIGMGFQIRMLWQNEPSGTMNSISMSRSQLVSLSGQLAISGATLIMAMMLCGIAMLPFVVVTPPAAWLIMLLGSAMTGVAAALAADRFARKHFR